MIYDQACRACVHLGFPTWHQPPERHAPRPDAGVQILSRHQPCRGYPPPASAATLRLPSIGRCSRPPVRRPYGCVRRGSRPLGNPPLGRNLGIRSEARTGLLPPGRGLKRWRGHARTYEERTVNVESVSPALVPNCAGVRAGRRFHPRCPVPPAIPFTAARPAVSYPRNCLISFVSLRDSDPCCRRERAGSASIGQLPPSRRKATAGFHQCCRAARSSQPTARKLDCRNRA